MSNGRGDELFTRGFPPRLVTALAKGSAVQFFVEDEEVAALGTKGSFSLKILRSDGTVRFVLNPSQHPATASGIAEPGQMCPWFDAAYPPGDRSRVAVEEVRSVCLSAAIHGEERTLDVSFIPIPREGCEDGEFVCIAHDRTEEAMARMVTHQYARREAEEVRHRMRNHLQGLISAVRLQVYSERSHEAREAVQRVAMRLDSLNQLHHLLDAEARGAEVASARTVLGQALTAQMKFYPNLPTVEAEFEDLRLPRRELATLGRILSELVCNAFTHAFVGRPPGTVWVKLTSASGAIVLEVADDGVGWNEQEPGARTPLGLSLVRHLVDAHGGTLQFVQGPGFSVRTTIPWEAS